MAASKKTFLIYGGFAAILIACSASYYASLLFRYPSGIHAWAQADRFALALRYYEDGMNFFKPATYSLRSVQGICGVEFPIQAYLAAALGLVFGKASISICFRMVTLFFCLSGLMALFAAAYKRTKDFIFSALVPLFIFSSPSLIDYSCSYMPDTASTGIVFGALYYVLDYIDTFSRKNAIIAILLLTLAALIKTSSGIYLVGFILMVILTGIYRNKLKDTWPVLLTSTAGIAIIISFYFHNQYLNSHYHSQLFLARAEPFRSGKELSDYINYSFKWVWMKEYFVLPAYLLFAGIFAAAVPSLRQLYHARFHLWCLLIFLSGALTMSYLMGHQLAIHDYYIIPIFFPLIAYALLLAIVRIRNLALPGPGLKSLRTGLLATLVILFCFADHMIFMRLNPEKEDNPFTASRWMAGGSRIADAAGIPPDAPVEVLGENPPNESLVYFHRRGYVHPMDSMDASALQDAIHEMQSNNVGYAIGETKKLKYQQLHSPEIFTDFSIVYEDARVIVMRLK